MDTLNWQNRRVLVTGAGGFIGSHLAERLVESGAKVRAFVHYNSFDRRGWLDDSDAAGDMDIIAGDIGDPWTVERAVDGMDTVFHLAALIGIPYSYVAPQAYVRTNIEGTLNVMQAARRHNVRRVVHTSTSEVYGTAKFVPITEEHPLQGQSPYSATKIGADKIAESFNRSFGLPVVTVRPFNTYGPRQSARAVIPTIISQCAAGLPVKLGNTHPTRDLTFVLDTVNGFLCAAGADAAIGRVVNIGSGREISIGDLATRIITAMGSNQPITTDVTRERSSGSEVERLLADNSLARELLNWSPIVALDQGIAATIEWIVRNTNRYRPESYTI